MLTDRIALSYPSTTDDARLDPEDYLSHSLGVIFPDDITNQHGDPSTPVIYTSPAFGKIFLSLADPAGENSRRLFAQYLWNAGVLLGIRLEAAITHPTTVTLDDEPNGTSSDGNENAQPKDPWDVRGEAVLELGAGTGLAGIVAARAGAEEVLLTDYPAAEVLANLAANAERNLADGMGEAEGERRRWRVVGHEWGVVPDEDEGADGELDGQTRPVQQGTTEHQQRVSIALPLPFPEAYQHHFTRILLADTLWQASTHEAQYRSIRYFLAPGQGRALVVAGFHTGRRNVAGFFDAERLRAYGLVVERIVEVDADGAERAWVVERGVEDVTARKRWLVVAVLRAIGGGGWVRPSVADGVDMDV